MAGLLHALLQAADAVEIRAGGRHEA